MNFSKNENTQKMKTLRYALRSLRHFRLFSVVNMLGLAVGLACVVVVARYVHTETTVDHFLKNHERLFFTQMILEDQQGRTSGVYFNQLPDQLTSDPAIERLGTYYVVEEQIEIDDHYYEIRALLADTTFLQIMDYPVLRGENNVWRPESALISTSFAKRIFGNDDPMGQTFKTSRDMISFTIVGVLDRLPGKSGFDFDLIIPDSRELLRRGSGFPLVELFRNQDYQSFNQKYADLIQRDKYGRGNYRCALVPLDQEYLSTKHAGGYMYRTGSRNELIMLSLVGFLILLTGLSNFINISLAVVSRRGREFGMKKVFGANGKNIFLQLWAENMCMVGLALVVAHLLIKIFSPLIQNILHFDQIPFRPFDVLLFVGLCGVIPLFVSVFPLLSYNYRKPISSLQGVGKTGGKRTVLRLLLGFQYALTFVMIIVSLLFMKQFRFMIQKDLGFRTKDIIQISIRYDNDKLRQQSGGDFYSRARSVTELLGHKIDESPLFTHWISASNPITRGGYPLTDIHLPGETTPEVSYMEVEKDWFDIFELKLVSGTIWDTKGPPIPKFLLMDRETPTMNTNLIFTESALKAFGLNLSNYADVSLENGQFVTAMTHVEDGSNQIDGIYGNLRIQGVVEDIYPDHLSRSKSLPPRIFIQMQEERGGYGTPLIASVVPGQKQEAIKYLQQAYKEVVGVDLNYTFLEDEIRSRYDEERKITSVNAIFTVIAILISVVGLFSLSLFDIQQRRREVAIRKVNGATTGVILEMLLKRYLKLLGIAFAVAAPIAWLVIQRYLEEFAVKTAVSWWIFAIAFLVTVGVSLLTLIWQTQKAAAANPAGVINNE